MFNIETNVKVKNAMVKGIGIDSEHFSSVWVHAFDAI